ncbi:sensor histidine kinase [Xanthomonadaceae bacterium XH05]|nr:sensor histidine kinase [Xanthomonadaceae bacterium XH05]
MARGLAGRLIALGLLSACLIALVGGWLLRSGLQSAMQHSFEQRLAERVDTVISRFSPGPDSASGGASVAYTEPRSGDEFSRIFSGWYWRLSGESVALRSRSLWDADVDDIGPVGSSGLSAVGPRGEALMGIARDVTLNDQSVRLEIYGPATSLLEELRAFDRLLVAIFAFLLLAMALTAVVQARFGLRPLARLRDALAQARSGARERLGTGYGPDLDPLAIEMDDLLERNARIVARARSHAADLAHALKKPLALLRSDADADVLVPSAQVRGQVQDMTRLIDRHLARAGSGAGERRPVGVASRLGELLGLMRQLHANRGLRWELQVPADLVWRGEVTDLEEMLGNLMDNAGKWASSHVRVNAARMKDDVVITIDDDGPGLSEAQQVRAARRGQRFDESVEGSGLGLAITADIAETYGGRLELTRSPLDGLRARLVLPA